MLEQIAKVTGHRFSDTDVISQQILRRIEAKLDPEFIDAGPASPGFSEAVLKAEAAVNAEGQLAIASLIKQLTAPKAERVFKIRQSLKGQRIKVAAPDGTRYSFGPVWNASVIAGKGPAYALPARRKLNHQALLAGIGGAESMDVYELGALVAATLSADEIPADVMERVVGKPKVEKSEKKKPEGRSFRFGPVWLEAVRTAGAVALNDPEKLCATAALYGIEVLEGETTAQLCVRIAQQMGS